MHFAIKNDDSFELASPDPASLIQSLRAFGYELRTALADIIDNSITAGAQNVWLDFEWNGPKSVIAVTDDGCGMDEVTLSAAMRLGSLSPLEMRAPHDLGRFGLGLKTASFSQCKLLTVCSKLEAGELCTRTWILDHVTKVNAWQLSKSLMRMQIAIVNDLKG